MIDLLIIQFLCVFVIDFSGAVDDLLTPLVKRITGARIGRLGKPFSCSLCMTFWAGLLYILLTGHFTLPYLAAVAGLAALTPVTLDIMNLVKDLASAFITFVYRIFGI